jgi:hypothetical protein
MMTNQQITLSQAPRVHHSALDDSSAPTYAEQPTHRPLTRLGEYLDGKSVNKAIVARKTGLSKQRMGELTLNENSKLRAQEIYLIALAIGVPPGELFDYVCAGTKLRD